MMLAAIDADPTTIRAFLGGIGLLVIKDWIRDKISKTRRADQDRQPDGTDGVDADAGGFAAEEQQVQQEAVEADHAETGSHP